MEKQIDKSEKHKNDLPTPITWAEEKNVVIFHIFF